MNTYSSHGQKGISDALVSALWGINFMLTTAEYGSVGVNFHGGGQNMDGNVCPNGVARVQQTVRATRRCSRSTAGSPRPPRSTTGCCWSRGSALATCCSTTAIAGSTAPARLCRDAGDGTTIVVLVNSEASTGVNATVDVGAALRPRDRRSTCAGRRSTVDHRRHPGRGTRHGRPGPGTPSRRTLSPTPAPR